MNGWISLCLRQTPHRVSAEGILAIKLTYNAEATVLVRTLPAFLEVIATKTAWKYGMPVYC